MHIGRIGRHADRIIARDAAAGTNLANAEARSARQIAARLQETVEQQALLIRTLITLCSRKGLFSEPEFRELMDEIDLSDGRLDGKYTPQAGPVHCNECGKVNNRRAVTCMYCGAELPREIL